MRAYSGEKTILGKTPNRHASRFAFPGISLRISYQFPRICPQLQHLESLHRQNVSKVNFFSTSFAFADVLWFEFAIRQSYSSDHDE